MTAPPQFRDDWDRDHWRQFDPATETPPFLGTDWAMLTDVLVECEEGWAHGKLTPAFHIAKERAFLWLPPKARYALLVVNVDMTVKAERIWRTLGSCLELGMAFRALFEHYPEHVGYDWIVGFEPRKPLDQQRFYIQEVLPARPSGEVKSPYDLRELGSFVDLLLRDERFYWACANLFTSYKNHAFCVYCAYEPAGNRKHPNHDLDPWHVAVAVPAMEVAIVQATRSVEAILGKPGRADDLKKRDRALARWEKAIPIEPSSKYEIAGESYFKYYSSLFGARGKAAHSLGRIAYALGRQLTIEAQCFAWEVVGAYFRRHGRLESRVLADFACELPTYGEPIRLDRPPRQGA